MSFFDQLPSVTIYYMIKETGAIGASTGSGASVTKFSLLTDVRRNHPDKTVYPISKEAAMAATREKEAS